MRSCPNQSSVEWKSLVKEYGENKAMWLFIRNGEELPSLSEASNIISNNEYEPVDARKIFKEFKYKKENPTLEESKFINDLSSVDKLTALKNKAIKVLEFKLNQQRHYNTLSIDEIEEKEKAIIHLNELESEKALVGFVLNAAKNTNSIYEKWKPIAKEIEEFYNGTSDKQLKDIVSIEQLKYFADYVGAYDTIDDYQDYLVLTGNKDSYKTTTASGKDVDIMDVLKETISTKNAIKKAWESYGEDLLAEYLAPYYNKIEVDFKNELGKKWKDMTAFDKQKYDNNEQKYRNTQLDINRSDIRKVTIDTIKHELRESAKDINFAIRWADSGLDTSDTVFGAMTQAFKFAEFKAREKKIELQKELSDVVENLDIKGDNKKFYDEILDYDSEGNAHLADRFGAKFWEAYDKYRETINSYRLASDFEFIYGDNSYKVTKTDKGYLYKENGKLVSKEKYHENLDLYINSLRKAWLKTNAPITPERSEDMRNDKFMYIDDLRSQGLVSDKEMLELEAAEMNYDTNYYKLAQKGGISDELARLLSRWISDNIWEYRTPDKTWSNKNTKWTNIEVARHSDSKTYDLYSALKKVDALVNQILPPASRLKHGRIPGIRKDIAEMRTSGSSFKEISKEWINRNLTITADDTERGQGYTDAAGNVINYVPIYYTNKLDPKEQSYDLPTNYFKLASMAFDYQFRSSILPEMELAKHFINTRKKIEKDRNGELKEETSKLTGSRSNKIRNEGSTNIAAQVNDWLDQNLYGVSEKPIGTKKILGMDVDIDRFIRLLNKYTSLNILGLNFKAATSNVLTSETFQKIEALSKQYLSIKQLTQASIEWDKQLPGLIEDVGKTRPKNKINLLLEHLGVAESVLNPNITDSRFNNLAKTSSLFFMTKLGDNWMTTRMFIGMLMNKEAYDSNGNSLGSMYENYIVDGGVLKLKPEVDLIKSNWTELDQSKWSNKTNGILASIHQEMDESGRAALQMHALGKMGIMFRRFIVPGIKRRWSSKQYRERFQDYTEGYYVTTGRFFVNLFKEFKTVGFSALSQEWSDLSDMEKANVIKMIGEMTFMITVAILAAGLTKLAGDDDDDDDWLFAYLHYQSLRVRSESMFFWNPGEAMKLLRSPMATMSTIENIGKFSSQILSPTEEYVRGPWKGHLKLEKIGWDFIPAARSMYQIQDIKSQINFMK